MNQNNPTKSSVRREYNRLVADETLEDYSLRYTPKSFRKFPEFLIANTAIGSISFLALEAIGASIAISYGFYTAFWAILLASFIIFLTAIPISYHAAKYNIDIDLITRSAGFGYVGSTITSLIYASFSFIFFALEAAILAQALDLYFGIPLAWGYLLSSLVIIPIVFYGITSINKLQLWTQPIWLVMMVAPFIAIFLKEPDAISQFMNFKGVISQSNELNFYYFGFALGISLSLIAQIGEQVDYLRFMPPLQKKNQVKWWFSVLVAGPGWIILGFLKQMGGILLAGVVIFNGLSIYEAKTPIEMYHIGYHYIFDNPSLSLGLATLFVIISQIKINVTNAYAGSLAWSNFFSRITHSHPGRVIWMVFNIGIAVLLMELGLFDALEKVLGLYSNVAIAWISAITADLLINKPCGLSPKIIEFKRAHLYNINPVGIGSMGIASIVSILSFMGMFGDIAQSYSSIIAMLLAFVLSPLIAIFTKGRYYIARENSLDTEKHMHYECQVCSNSYEVEDMAYCPFHNVNICSLCCSLDSLCHDSCKKEKEGALKRNIAFWTRKLFINKISATDALRVFYFITLTSIILFSILVANWMVFSSYSEGLNSEDILLFKTAFKTLFFIITIIISILIWWILLSHENRLLAENELEEQKDILQYQAQHDVLTDLPNRVLFQDRLTQSISKAKRYQKIFGLFFIDLDRFKQINDSLGHAVGDEVLKKTSVKLLSLIREEDTLARLGGDEFTIIVQDLKTGQDASVLAQKILNILEKPIYIDNHTLYISCSIGISLYPLDNINANKLLMYADAAMYMAKDKGKNNYQFYSSELTTIAYEHLTMESNLRKAIKNDEFVIHYQPQVDANNSKIIGMEALVRWQGSNGLIPPDRFIPLARETGLIVELDKLVIKKAMHEFSLWKKKKLNPGTLALNLEIQLLQDEDFINYLKKTLIETNLHSQCLEFEVTEGQIMINPESAISILNKLTNMGIELAIDDFGTGYSSLSYLKKLPLDKLKIDKSFVQDVTEDEEDAGIVKAVIALAKSLNLSVIAEGVETEEQKEFLVENGCAHIQGYYYSKPIPADEIEKMLSNGGKLP